MERIYTQIYTQTKKEEKIMEIFFIAAKRKGRPCKINDLFHAITLKMRFPCDSK